MPFQKGHKLWKHPNSLKTQFKRGGAGHSMPHTELSKLKMSKSKIGKGLRENNGSWRGGTTPLINKIKRLVEYKNWQKCVLRRDNFTCRKCLVRGGVLTPHHLTAFSFLVRVFKIRSIQNAIDCFWIWNIRNGVTLCRDCHKETSNFGWRAGQWPRDRELYSVMDMK